MRLDRIAAAVGLFLGAGLSYTFPRESGQGAESRWRASRDYCKVPTTLATLPLDSEGLTVDPDTRTHYAAEAPDPSGEGWPQSRSRSLSMSTCFRTSSGTSEIFSTSPGWIFTLRACTAAATE